MEKRAETRRSIRGTATLTLLCGTEEKCTAEMVNISGRGMRLISGCAIPLGVPIRVDAEDCMWLGEVCYCEPAGSGYAVGLRLDQCLSHVSSLERLTRSLLGADGAGRERRGERAPLPVGERG